MSKPYAAEVFAIHRLWARNLQDLGVMVADVEKEYHSLSAAVDYDGAKRIRNIDDSGDMLIEHIEGTAAFIWYIEIHVSYRKG